MESGVAFLLDGHNVAFTAALALMLALMVIEALGFGAGEAGIDAHAGGMLDWLGIGRVPLLILLALLLASFGVIGLVGQQVAAALTTAPVAPLIAVPLAFAAALPTTGAAVRLLAPILPRDETTAVQVDALVGRVATILTGVAQPGSPARARVIDHHGHPHLVMAEPANAGQRFAEGETVLLVERRAHHFAAVAWENPLLPSPLES